MPVHWCCLELDRKDHYSIGESNSFANLTETYFEQIAISFHIRTYADRIELNKFQIASLTKLYAHAKETERATGSGDFAAVDFEEIAAKEVFEKARQSIQQALAKGWTRLFFYNT